MKAELISIGTELLLGQIVDTNAAFLASELPALGIDCYYISQVGDNLERLVETLGRAWARSDLVITTGGLGPTEDDLTREGIAALLGETMSVQPELEAQLRARFARLGRQMPESNLKQASLIPSAQPIANPVGSAPGWWVQRVAQEPAGTIQIIVAMPGVPSEMRRMWEHEVKPRLRQMAGGAVIVSRTLKVLGLGESNAEDMIRHLLGSTNPTIGTYAKQDGIHLRLTAKAPDEAQALGLIAPMEQQIRQVLGNAVYGVDDESPQAVVCDLLKKHGLVAATAEYGTAGALGSLLGQATGSPGCFAGGLQAGSHRGMRALGQRAGAAPMCSLVGPDGAVWLAALARTALGADIGLSLAGVLTPDPDEPAPVGAMYVALDDGISPPRTASLNYATTPTEMRRLGALAALNLLRLALLAR
jgi:nicotinamide-nucleotide amidase